MSATGTVMGALPDALRKYVDAASPRSARMMAAQGLVPLPPKDMLWALCALGSMAHDDAELAATAQHTLTRMPDKMITGALGVETPGPLLGQLAMMSAGRDSVLEPLVLHRNTPDNAIAAIASQASEKIAELISSDQERCLRSERLIRAIQLNTNLLKSSRERLFDFLVRSGIFHDDLSEFSEALSRLSPKEMQEMADTIVLPQELAVLLQPTGDDDDKTATVAEAVDGDKPYTPPTESDEEPTDAKRVSMLKLINGLSVAQRVALATRGNKEARTILMRDPNRLVATAVIRSPRITDAEVANAASNRSVNDEVIRIICNSKEMSRSYGVKVALVNNPKTPVPIAMRMLPALRMPDLKNVAQSRGIPSGIANQAKILLRQRNG